MAQHCRSVVPCANAAPQVPGLAQFRPSAATDAPALATLSSTGACQSYQALITTPAHGSALLPSRSVVPCANAVPQVPGLAQFRPTAATDPPALATLSCTGTCQSCQALIMTPAHGSALLTSRSVVPCANAAPQVPGLAKCRPSAATDPPTLATPSCTGANQSYQALITTPAHGSAPPKCSDRPPCISNTELHWRLPIIPGTHHDPRTWLSTAAIPLCRPMR